MANSRSALSACIVCDLRKSSILNWVVAAAVGVVAALAVADALRPGRPSSSTPGAAPPVTAPRLSMEEEIERIGNEWAPRFAAGTDRCFHMNQPVCERIACRHVGGLRIENCKPLTKAFQKSFEDAVVEDVAVKGNRGAAQFSNGQVIEFHGDRGTWWISKLGGSAGLGLLD